MRQLATCVGAVLALYVAVLLFVSLTDLALGQDAASSAVLAMALIVSAVVAAFFLPVGDPNEHISRCASGTCTQMP